MADVRTPEDMERLMDRYGDRMLRLCCMYLNDEHMAQDAVQDSFLKIYRNAQTFETPEMEKGWVMRVAINTCKDYLRSAWKRRVRASSRSWPRARARLPRPRATTCCAER